MSRKIFFALVCSVAFTALAEPASAQWSQSERNEFTNNCLSACRNNPNVADAAKPQCVTYCACVLDGAQGVEPNYRVLNDDFLNNRDTERVRAMRSLVPGCNSKAFSR
jgi:hypothetical protein